MLCDYKDIFGKPNIGIHEKRFLGYALNDIIGTIILSYILQYFYKDISLIKLFIIMFLIGQICHIIFCVDTQFIKLFF